jgi:hypothetical protein
MAITTAGPVVAIPLRRGELVRNVLRTIGAAGAAAAIVFSGVAAANAASATLIKSGKTVVTLDAVTMTAVSGGGLKIQAFSPATQVGRTLTLPTSGGTATPPSYVENETGGFAVSHAGTTVRFTELTFDTAHHVAHARVTGQGRIAALILGDPQNGSGGPGFVQFGAYPVNLTAAAVRALDTALHTQVFGKLSRLGIGSSTVRF